MTVNYITGKETALFQHKEPHKHSQM